MPKHYPKAKTARPKIVSGDGRTVKVPGPTKGTVHRKGR